MLLFMCLGSEWECHATLMLMQCQCVCVVYRTHLIATKLAILHMALVHLNDVMLVKMVGYSQQVVIE